MKFPKCWCGSEAYSVYSQFNTKLFNKGGFKIKVAKCNDCGTVRMYDNGLNKIPDYETAYYYEKISGRHLRTISIISDYFYGNSILDIGCNTGMLLNEIQNRIPSLKRFKGVDLDSNAINIGRQKYGLDLEAVDAKQLEEKFDNIVLCHTLEHVPDLRDFAVTLDRLLNPGGRIFISVPNIESLGAKYFLRFWPALSPMYHLWYFDASSVKKYFNTMLPVYVHLKTSSYFVWKPLIFPAFYWKRIIKNDKKIGFLEQQMKGDQLDFVVSKPV
jgi:2-polyprenyl-3-methyl-5-hydroxy-6-metoxy-1,4-benzoquinol methylase